MMFSFETDNVEIKLASSIVVPD